MQHACGRAASTPTYKEKTVDIEQLKIVLETLQSVSHDAGNIAVLWLWLKFGSNIAGQLFWAVAICAGAYTVFRAVKMAHGVDGTDTFLREMRDVLQTGSGGALTDRERHDTQNRLRAIAHEFAIKTRK